MPGPGGGDTTGTSSSYRVGSCSYRARAGQCPGPSLGGLSPGRGTSLVVLRITHLGHVRDRES